MKINLRMNWKKLRHAESNIRESRNRTVANATRGGASNAVAEEIFAGQRLP